MATSRVLQSSTTTAAAPAPAVALHEAPDSTSWVARARTNWGIYKELSKPTLSALVVGSTSAGFLFAGSPVHIVPLTAVSVGTMLQAWSANTFNQVWETRNDALMKRTKRRPMPTGRISRPHALGWGIASGAVGTGILGLGCDPLTAALGMTNIALYSLVYTPMKTRSVMNTWVGSLVGALPPVMGWTAAVASSGGAEPMSEVLCAPESALLASTLFLWQFPHFFALSWRSRSDYAAGGYKMVPVLDDAAGTRTGQLVHRYSLYMAAVPFASTAAGLTSSMFALESILFNGYFLSITSRFRRKSSNKHAQDVFRASLWYLPLMLTLMVYHSKHWNRPKGQTEGAGEEKGAHCNNDAGFTERMDAAVEACVARVREEITAYCPHEWAVLTDSRGNKTAAVSSAVPTSAGARLDRREDCPPLLAQAASKVVAAAVATKTESE